MLRPQLLLYRSCLPAVSLAHFQPILCPEDKLSFYTVSWTLSLPVENPLGLPHGFMITSKLVKIALQGLSCSVLCSSLQPHLPPTSPHNLHSNHNELLAQFSMGHILSCLWGFAHAISLLERTPHLAIFNQHLDTSSA